MKIAIVVGHNSRAKGAARVTDGVQEYDWNAELAEAIRDHDPANIKIFRRQAGLGYSREIDKVYREVDKWGADCSLELHFNASASASATGCLMLSSGTPRSLALARRVQAECLRVLDIPDLGVKVRKRHERGGRSLWQGRAPAVLTEPYMGSNRGDCMRADSAFDQLAEAHYRAVMQWTATA